MAPMPDAYQLILSLPRACAAQFGGLDLRVPAGTVVTHDPEGAALGSGGGLAHALVAAWSASGSPDLGDWLGRGTRLVVHAGGESRRTPAYAPEGKVFTPIPVLRWSFGQRLDQSLLDLQLPFVEQALAAADAAAAVYSGDVLLQGRVPARLPQADVVCFGMWTTPEAAARHGVFFCERHAPDRLVCMLQKPSPAEVKELASRSLYLLDTGLWLFSRRAVLDLLVACGWDGHGFRGGRAEALDLYGGVGLALGQSPRLPHPVWGQWSCAVVPVEGGEFYHFGTSRELVETTLRLQNAHLDQRHFGRGGREHPATFIQNAEVGLGLHATNHTVWVENATIPANWSVQHSHILTGIPENTWALHIPAGSCLDAVPIDGARWAVRFYGIDDTFRGPAGDRHTLWLGCPVEAWFRERGLTLAECGIDPSTDLQHARLFPVISGAAGDGAFVQWLLGLPEGEDAAGAAGSLINRPVATGPARRRASARRPAGPGDFARLFRDGPRLSATELAARAHLGRRAQQRARLRERALTRLAHSPAASIFLRTDLSVAAETFAQRGLPLPAAESVSAPLDGLHLRMFRAAVRKRLGDAGWDEDERAAFDSLRGLLCAADQLPPALPRRQLLADQIIWGRSPVRIDLAGGWTDTPPYCLIHGGCVVNLAVELNGQPPIQVFGRCGDEPQIVIRSIDLGQEQCFRTYEELRGCAEVGAAFSIPKAALALCGFLPEFAAYPAPTLRQALERFGGGIELTLLAAVPKGSGLGTSSILAATVLGTLNDLCSLGWDRDTVIRRTLCLEQMLTTGGGWQDQAGGILPGLKLLKSAPGAPQIVQTGWLPDTMVRRQCNHTVLLYYTGITRVAKGILQDVVRGMFLNHAGTLRLLARIGENALRAADVLQRQDTEELGAVIRQSWELNCALDAGTNPPAVRALLERVTPWLSGAKLLGAGGGGYLLMVAADEEGAARIRRELTTQPPNAAARFVGVTVSDSGLQVTRS